MKPSADAIDDLIGQVVELTWSYSIWWELGNEQNRARYKDVLGAYPNLFKAVMFSMQQGFCVISWRLFDKDGRTRPLRKLIANLQKSDRLLSQRLASRIDKHKQLLSKVQLLRHNVYGHRNELLSPKDAFAQAGISPKDMKTILLLVQETVVALAEITGLQTKDSLVDKFRHCEDNVKEETTLILQALERNGGF